MRRDWDVIREVLSEIEGLTPPTREEFGYGVHRGYVADQAKVEHAKLLLEAGFIRGIETSTLEGFGLLSPELTWAGHDLLDTIRSRRVWEQIKTTARDKGLELTFDVVKALAGVAIQKIVAS